MSETVHNKLVRDKIPDRIRESGREPVTENLTDDEAFLKALDAKLQEEVAEYIENPSMEEIADVLEVLEAIVAIRRFPQAELRRKKNQKALKNGTFHDRVFLKKVVEP